MSDTEVSVIIVFRNEAQYIVPCIDSVAGQFSEDMKWELLLVNSNSDDNSVQLIKEKLANSHINYKLLDNPGKTLSKGWNIGIKSASGKYIIRPDAHALLQSGYIIGALHCLRNVPEVGVVGGVLKTEAKTKSGFMIREALSMRTGVGNSSFRTGESSGYKDTAVYGLYRKEVFETVGLFNENLIRHQDTEFHHRVLEKGYKIYMNSHIKATYFCRDSFRSLGRQMYEIGYNFSGLVRANAGDSLRLRHWIPMLFYMGLMLLLALSVIYSAAFTWFLLVISSYLIIIFTESLYRTLNTRSLISMTSLFIIPFIHINYASGTIMGMLSLLSRK